VFTSLLLLCLKKACTHLFIDLQILMCISVHMICNKMYINNESCRCIDAKSWKCSAETFLILSKLKITIFPFFIVFDALKYPFFKVVPLDFQFLTVTLIIMLLMDNTWDTQMEKFEAPFFSSWNKTKFAKHQRLLHK
jgi:hypothetical protein